MPSAAGIRARRRSAAIFPAADEPFAQIDCIGQQEQPDDFLEELVIRVRVNQEHDEIDGRGRRHQPIQPQGAQPHQPESPAQQDRGEDQ